MKEKIKKQNELLESIEDFLIANNLSWFSHDGADYAYISRPDKAGNLSYWLTTKEVVKMGKETIGAVIREAITWGWKSPFKK